MKRLYHPLVQQHLRKYRQMVFLMGPRQVGKTTTSQGLMKEWKVAHYFNWDNRQHRLLIAEGPDAVAEAAGLSSLENELVLIVFDEIHKFHDWKLFLKGLYDTYPNRCRIVVTGSARLDVFKKGGDSLMGRYFRYHFHPLSVGEILKPDALPQEISPPAPIDDTSWHNLLTLGGFPDPFVRADPIYLNRWQDLRLQQLVKEDLQDLTRIHEISQLELLQENLRCQVGQLLNYSALATKIGVTGVTVRSWIEVFKSLYYCYTIAPWSKNISRSLTKNPKPYLWDWTLCEDKGARAENFVSSHLLKAIQMWTDCGYGKYELYFLRDKEGREVDFLVVKDRKPWFLVEVKSSGNKSPSPALYHYQNLTGAKHAFQVVLDKPYVDVDCFSRTDPVIVPARTFLSQLI